MPQSSTIQQRAEAFEAFHKTNPHVYQHILKLAREIKAIKDVKRWSIRNIWQKLRWDVVIELNKPEDERRLNIDVYKLNDHHTPFYARMMMRDHPDEFRGWLEIRGRNCVLPEGV